MKFGFEAFSYPLCTYSAPFQVEKPCGCVSSIAYTLRVTCCTEVSTARNVVCCMLQSLHIFVWLDAVAVVVAVIVCIHIQRPRIKEEKNLPTLPFIFITLNIKIFSISFSFWLFRGEVVHLVVRRAPGKIFRWFFVLTKWLISEHTTDVWKPQKENLIKLWLSGKRWSEKLKIHRKIKKIFRKISEEK